MRAFAYERAERLEDVLPMLGRDGDGSVRPLAGGTDLLPLLKSELTAPERLVDVKRIADLPRGINQSSEGLELGALATLAEIESNADVLSRARALAEAASWAATPQLRNMATLGGNLLQRPRCWYFRNPHIACWLKGGDDCPARDGENQQHATFQPSLCVAVHPSDLATALVALDAAVRVRGAAGERTVPMESFFAPPTEERRTETTLGPDELILAVHLPAGTWRSRYAKAMDRKVWAFALAGLAVAVRTEGGSIADARVVIGGVAPVPWRAREAEQELVSSGLDAESARRAADAALAGATPLRNNAYKVPLVRGLFTEVFRSLAEERSTPT